jgi:hypothetical protein
MKGVAYFKVLFWNSSGGIKENVKHLKMIISQLRLEMVTS